MTDITDYATLLAEAHQTDDLDKIPSRDADKLRAMFLTPEYHDFADLFSLQNDESRAFEYLRVAIASWNAFLDCSLKGRDMYTTLQAHYEAASSLAQHLSLLGTCLVNREAQDALREAYDRLHPESDGIAAEDERARGRDWRATA